MVTSSRTGWIGFVALTGALLGASGTHAADDKKNEATINAVWNVHQLEFAYDSPNISYECESLQKRIKQILETVGAYSNMVVETTHCRRKEQVRRTDIRLTVAMPAEATDENVRKAAEFDVREEIVARLSSTPLPTSDVKVFPASWRTVTLSNSGPAKIVAGDCDLVRALRDQVFPRINVRVSGSGMNCGAGSDTRIQPKMRVQALIPTRT
jgi:hypothetical protein